MDKNFSLHRSRNRNRSSQLSWRVFVCVCVYCIRIWPTKNSSAKCVEHLSFRVFLYPVALVFFVRCCISFVSCWFRFKFHWASWSFPFACIIHVRGLFGMAHLSRIASRYFFFSCSIIFTFILFTYSMGRENNALKMDCAICFLSSCCSVFCRLLHSKR